MTKFIIFSGSGIFFVNWGNSRKPLAKLSLLKKSGKRNHWKSRILEYGCATILVLVLTICTENTVIWLYLLQLHNAIAIWELVTVPEPILFKSSELNPWPPAKQNVLSLNKCTILRSSSLCLPVSKRALDHFSRLRDPTLTFFKFWFFKENKISKYWKYIYCFHFLQISKEIVVGSNVVTHLVNDHNRNFLPKPKLHLHMTSFGQFLVSFRKLNWVSWNELLHICFYTSNL